MHKKVTILFLGFTFQAVEERTRDKMASSKLSCWAVYYNNHQVILSALFLLISVMSNWAHLLLPTTLWLAYSLYTTFGTTEIPGREKRKYFYELKD